MKTQKSITERGPFQKKMCEKMRNQRKAEALAKCNADIFDNIPSWDNEIIATLLQNESYFKNSVDSEEFQTRLNNLIAPYLVSVDAMINPADLVWYVRNYPEYVAHESEEIVCKIVKEISLFALISGINHEIIADLTRNAGTIGHVDREGKYPKTEAFRAKIFEIIDIIKSKTKVEEGEFWVVTNKTLVEEIFPSILAHDPANRFFREQKTLDNFTHHGNFENVNIYSYRYYPENQILIGMKSPIKGYCFYPFLVVGPKKQSEYAFITEMQNGKEITIPSDNDQDIFVMWFAKKLLREGSKNYGIVNIYN
jgi:hypothetical protein